jgi:glycosyltransferase involved in cell wall biosynthesis
MLGFAARRRYGARLVAALSHASICVSEAVRTPLVDELRFPAAATHTVRNGVDLARYSGPAPAGNRIGVRRRLGFGALDVVVVVACRLEPTKGVDVLLQALHGLCGRLPQLGAIIAGSGSAALDLRRMGEELGLSQRIRWLGFQEDVRPYLRAGDIFVNPSSTTCVEAFGLSVAEAMASGLACIASEAGAGPELIRDGEEGLLVAPGDVAAMQEAVARLASAPDERQRMGERARERAHREFDLERCMQRILAILLPSEEGAPCPKLA